MNAALATCGRGPAHRARRPSAPTTRPSTSATKVPRAGGEPVRHRLVPRDLRVEDVVDTAARDDRVEDARTAFPPEASRMVNT